MLAIGRGLIKNPEILLPDELSEGLVPLVAA
jgi:ABC-type branched-subunit amino acid transport system ATPase component